MHFTLLKNIENTTNYKFQLLFLHFWNFNHVFFLEFPRLLVYYILYIIEVLVLVLVG